MIPHPHYPDVGARFYENARPAIPPSTEPPPAHRNPQMNATPPINYAPPGELPPHLMPKAMEREREREREQREKERKSSIPGLYLNAVEYYFAIFSLFFFLIY